MNLADFYVHDMRKTKRVRTAFAPMQLLELERTFESNQYVVGSERRALAKQLRLTEIQVNSPDGMREHEATGWTL